MAQKSWGTPLLIGKQAVYPEWTYCHVVINVIMFKMAAEQVSYSKLF